MQPHSYVFAGPYTQRWADGSVVEQVRCSFYDWFTGTNNGRGDRKKPVAHSFTKHMGSGLSGSINCTNLITPNLSWVKSGVQVDARSFPNESLPSYMQDKAYQKCLGKLNDDIRGGVDLSIDFAQRKQTAQMIRSTANVFAIAREIKRELTKHHPKHWMKYFGSKWLEYRYGWQPSLQTIYDCAKYVTDKDRGMQTNFRARASEFKLNKTVPYNFYGVPVEQRTQYNYRVEIGICLAPRDSVADSLAGLTSLNPASIAWEMLPFSFVVDWFLDVGGYLRNAETAMMYGNLFYYGYRTDSYKIKSELDGNGKSSQGSAIYDVHVSGNYVQTYKSRAPLSSYPFPRAPVLTTDLGSGRLANAAALLSQFFGR